jgi:pSer/pThr/pTyr-binding forkhead associated (FHA) protein
MADEMVALPVPGTLLVGRGAECDVALADPSISRKHARVVARTDGTVVVQDLGSVLGLTVNGVRVHESRAISHGDRLGIGAHTLVLVDGDVKRTPTRRTPVEATSREATTSQLGSSAVAVALENALDANDRTLAEALAARAVTGLTRGGHDVGTIARLERSLAKLGETDAFWLDRILDLRGAHRSVPDASIVTRMHALARAGRVCTPEVLRRYLEAVATRTDLPMADQVLYRRMQALSRAPSDG